MSTLPENAPDSRPTAESPVVAPGAAVTQLIEAIDALADILTRMVGHADKKRDMLRRLRSWAL
ncbi:hypothetical protein [Micrococcus porci]|uniref:hypothetical protein n=1 Tax=Micrococcus porci TaxID=2856555 RepID=UPI003CF5D546